jgi:hypothetical protein
VACIVRLVSLGADGAEHSTDVLRIARPGDLTDLASLGLTLAEGKQLLAGLQQEIVAAQARVHALRWPDCHGCGTAWGLSRDWGDMDGSDMTRRAAAGWETWTGSVLRLVVSHPAIWTIGWLTRRV